MAKYLLTIPVSTISIFNPKPWAHVEVKRSRGKGGEADRRGERGRGGEIERGGKEEGRAGRGGEEVLNFSVQKICGYFL
jgi:hypothetical protein